MASFNFCESGAFSALWRYNVSMSVDDFLVNRIGFSRDWVFSSSLYSTKSAFVEDFAVSFHMEYVYLLFGLNSHQYFDCAGCLFVACMVSNGGIGSVPSLLGTNSMCLLRVLLKSLSSVSNYWFEVERSVVSIVFWRSLWVSVSLKWHFSFHSIIT
jgi:hypothetical protein